MIKDLLFKTGLTAVSAARLLDVPYETVRNWLYEKSPTPAWVLKRLEAYAKAADAIFLQARK